MKLNKHNAYRALIRGRLQDMRQHPNGLWERIKYSIYLIGNMSNAIIISDTDLEKALRDE